MNAHFSRNFANRWQSAGHPPDGLVPYKGSVHIVGKTTRTYYFCDYMPHIPIENCRFRTRYPVLCKIIWVVREIPDIPI